MYIPLKITTDYSLLKSCIKINDLIPFLKMNYITVAAICDNNLFGCMEFYENCQKNNIKPIIGMEVKYNEQIIYLYAKNYAGFQNLLKINSILNERDFSHYDLELYHHDLKIIIPYENILIYDEIKEITKEVYIGYTTEYEKNNAFIKTNHVVFVKNIKGLKNENDEDLNYLEMIHLGSLKSQFPFKSYEKNIWNDEDLTSEDFQYLEDFVHDIELTIPKKNRYIPHYDETIKDSFGYLEALAKKGLLRRKKNQVPEEYNTRLNFELKVIKTMDFVDYFLIVYDYVFFAKKHGILVGPGRGSAAGSLVSYSLGITDIDPLEYHLLFERFLNPERVSMPDIDIDFEYTKRNQVIDYVKNRYGQDCVAGIMTFGTLGSKLVLRDIGKILEIDTNLINKFVNFIDPKLSLKENLLNPNVQYYLEKNDAIKTMYEKSLHLEGLKRHISTHAAGLVISSVSLDTVIPICKSGAETLTGVTMNYLEELGLLKMDFLALKNLTIIQNILDLIFENLKIKININALDLNDPKVMHLFTVGDTSGIFQYESTGMKNFLQKLKPTTFADLVASIALYRPGPMQNIDSYIRRKEKKEKIDYIHPDLEMILKETYGIIVYQEQIMQVLVTIGGYSYAESDNIRRAMSKKKKEIIEQEKEHFIANAIERKYDKTLANKIYELILSFANYGFNKAHSVSYALIGYQMAYLKTYYPIYYIANLLNMSINDTKKTSEYLSEVRKKNYFIEKPDINQSTNTYIIKENKLIIPFTCIKNIGTETSIKIIEEREKQPFLDFFDFVARTIKLGINKKTIENLINAEVFRSMEKNTETLKENIDIAINYATLITDLDESFVMKPQLKKTNRVEEPNRMNEMETFGFYISNHPSSKFTEKNIMKFVDIKEHFDKFVKCVVVIENIKKIKTKKQVPMAFLSVSDDTGYGDVTVFSNAIGIIEKLEKNDFVLIEGKVTKRFDQYQIIANNITKQ